MERRTTIQIPRAVLERLQRQGHKGQTYAEILTEIMDRADRQRFIEEQVRRAQDRDHLVPAEDV